MLTVLFSEFRFGKLSRHLKNSRCLLKTTKIVEALWKKHCLHRDTETIPGGWSLLHHDLYNACPPSPLNYGHTLYYGQLTWSQINHHVYNVLVPVLLRVLNYGHNISDPRVTAIKGLTCIFVFIIRFVFCFQFAEHYQNTSWENCVKS